MDVKKEHIEPINLEEEYTTDYEKIMELSDGTFLVNTEWSEDGDTFQKLSIYEDFTPVQTSDHTTLISKY